MVSPSVISPKRYMIMGMALLLTVTVGWLTFYINIFEPYVHQKPPSALLPSGKIVAVNSSRQINNLRSKDVEEEVKGKPSSLQITGAKLKISEKKSSVKNGAFVYLALGAQANQMNCPASIESLVKYGGWDGHVYLITDRASCFDAKEITKNAGMEPSKLHIMETEKDFGGFNYDFRHRDNIGARKNRVESFAMKTMLFDYVEDQTIDTIAYTDCDVLFKLNGCARDMVMAEPSWEETRLKVSYVYRDKAGRPEGLHIGTFVAHREYSKEALALWKKEIEKGIYEGDNDAYAAAYVRFRDQNHNGNTTTTVASTTKGKTSVGNSTAISAARGSTKSSKSTIASTSAIAVKQPQVRAPWNPMEMTDLHFPGKDRDSRETLLERFYSPELAFDISCTTHITKHRCMTFGRDHIQKFVDQFDLKTYEGGYQYCTHPYLHTLLYGWFPVSYIPFCPKFEKLL